MSREPLTPPARPDLGPTGQGDVLQAPTAEGLQTPWQALDQPVLQSALTPDGQAALLAELQAELLHDLPRLQAEALGWQELQGPDGERAYLHVDKPQGDDLVIEVCGQPLQGHVGANVLLWLA